ncbi:alpha/beta fold hydrolase [Ornithinimicrobium sp. INDO-MA30-4]|uniref:alpha/beta fold hydrolase n=1 Tax=Ornithinimicrobium sp. INDO-MA30-4 TaxID=2908651 RepID=UPI001F3BF371|nr:alpha/beta fold hydrolase [Ornithinimicrobium sp. INDO-MA30-4]UJH70382.1 alpha/beta fold hydrolase [Ornithinimicrobium sp. INDO-MA30-4]
MSTGFVTSDDGTEIAWSRQGDGPALVMIECVGASRATSPQPTLPAALAARFSVWRYDRRGKGDSGNNQPYAVEREFEDLAAVIGLVGGGPVDIYGFSSGATLALLAAEAGLPIRRLALLEPPLNLESDHEHALAREAQRRVDADVEAATGGSTSRSSAYRRRF